VATSRRDLFERLRGSLVRREPGLLRTFGVVAPYKVWTSDFVSRALETNPRHYRSYVSGAVAGMRALEQVLETGVGEPAHDLTAESFVTELVGVGVGGRAHAAIERLLSGEVDILLEPRRGEDWADVEGIRLSRSHPGLVEVTSIQTPELTVIPGTRTGDMTVQPGAGVLVVAPGSGIRSGIESGRVAPIVVEFQEPEDRLLGELGRHAITADSVRFGYQDIDVFGVEHVSGIGRAVSGLHLGDDIPSAQARALIQAQNHWLAQRDGIVTADTMAEIVERASSSLDDMSMTARMGANDVLASFVSFGDTSSVPMGFAAVAAQEVGSALEDELGTLQPERPSPSRKRIRDGGSERRKLAVDVRGELSDKEPILVLVKLALLSSAASQYESPAFNVKLRLPVTIELAVVGFEVIGNSAEELRIEKGIESPTLAFKLGVLDTAVHSVVVRAVQDGQVLNQVEIKTFPDSFEVDVPEVLGQSVDIRVRIDEQGVVRFWDREARRPVQCAGRLTDEAASRSRGNFDNMAREVDAKTKTWDDARLEREVLEFGRSASKELPQELVTALSGRTGLSVQIIHPEKVDFPFELAILWMDGQEIFMGAAHAVTRWPHACNGPGIYPDRRAVSTSAMATTPRVSKVAGNGYGLLKEYLEGLCQVEPFDSMKAIDRDVLRTDRFQVLDVVAHLASSANGTGLELVDALLRVSSFGEPQKVFCSGAALVFLNACSAGGGVTGPFGVHTYPPQLLRGGVGAVVGSTLPVNVKVGVSIARHLYEGLASGSGLGQALLNARLETIKDDTTSPRLGTRQLTALAYCAFGHPEMTLAFASAIPTALGEAS
jgi:hypothetical protein